ncbi:Transcription elongation factor spt6 [Linnemannia elongata]|nr:Transcription elongation factor spt6 [Linnemannia elongata]
MTNDEVAKLYQSSKRGVEDHPKAYEITRYCISLARTIQSPINEYAATGVDLIGIRLHPLQEFVGADRLRELLDRALVNVINDVGVDINEVVSSPYKALMLPYICGLGTRKAQHLIGIIERDPVTRGVDKRSDMVNRKMLTWNIFMNCCSFLRVHTERGGDILDQTRIHFQDYNLARKMAADALEIDEVGLQEYDEESQHVEELMRDDNAERLNELLLDDYAHQLQKMQQKPKRMTLEHIKAELQHPFRDHRTQFVPATPDQIFTMLTGETDQTLREGFILPALVTKVREKNAMCRLDCGIDGILSIQNISDSRIGSVKDHVSEGQTLQVKILRLEKARFFADLTCKESELRQGDAHLRALPLDRTFDQFEEDRFKDPADPNDNKSGFVHRKIHHPLFKNITSEAAIKYLSTRNRGELVIRPSNRGADHLIITVKIADDIYKHYDVLEINKRDDISLGKVLQIDDSTYIDLDDLLVSHIEAILSRCHDLMSSPKYRENEYELRAWLEEQTRIRPDVAVYGFTLSRKYPGYFSLIFKLGHHAKIDEWNIKVLPSFFQLKGPSKRNCVDPTAISDNFKDMASKISHRNRTSKKPGNLPDSGSTTAFDSSSAHRNRSQSRHRNSISSNATSFSAQAKSRPPSDRGYSPGSNSNAHSASAAYDRSRSRPRYQNGGSNTDSRFQDIGFDDYSFQDSDFPGFQSATRTNPNTSWNARGRSMPYDDSNIDTDNNYTNSWNDRSKSKSRPGYGDRSAEVNTHGSWIDGSKSRPRPGYGDRNSHNNDGHIGTNTDNIPITSRSKSRSSYGDGDAHNGSNSNWDDRGRSRYRPGYNGADGASSAAWNNRGHSSYRSGEGDANNNRNASWSNRGRSSHRGGETNAADNRGRSRYRDGGGDVDNDRNTSWSNRGRSSYRSGDGNAADNRERSRYRGRDNSTVSSGDGSWGSRGRSSNRSGEATAAVNRGRPSYRGRDKNADSNGDGSWSNRGRSRHRGRDSNADGDNASWNNRGRSSHRSRDNDAENNSGAAWNNRGKSSYRGRDHNADSSTNSSWKDRSKSKPRYGYGNNNSNTSGRIGTSTNNIPVGSRAKSMARYGADASSGPSIPTTFSTGYGSSYQEAGTQDSSRPSYKSFAATSSQELSMDFAAYSPEPVQATGMMKPAADLSFPQPSDFAAYYKEPAGAAASAVHGRRDSDQPMHSAVYSPEPKKPANSNVPPSAKSSSLQPPDLKARSPEPKITEEYVRFLRVGHGASQPMDITAYSPESTKPEGSSKPAEATTARSYSPQPSTRSASSQLTVRSDSSQPTITSGSSQPPARSGSSQPTDFSAYSPEPMQATNPTRPTESTKSMPKPATNSTVKSGSPQAARAQAYSPELNGGASSVDTSDPSQPMDFTAYSPEPIELAVPPRTVTEAYKPWSSSSSATTGGGGYGGDEDDTGGISWGSGSYGGSSGSGGNRSHGSDRSRSYGDNRQGERHGRFGDNGRSDSSSDRRPYQSPPPRQQQLQSNYGLGYGGKGQHHLEGDRENRPGGDDDDDGGISWGSGSYGASGGGGGGGYGSYGNSGSSEYGDRGRSINKQGYGRERSNDRNGGNGGGSRRESRPRSRSRRH